MHKLTWGLTGIRRCQGEDRGSYSFFGEAQTKHWRNNNRQRPRGEAATLRIVQVRSPITTSPILVNGLLSTLEEIERRSRALLEKGIAARFVDKGEDSKEVARLIDRLREAITHYQVSGNYFVASDMIQTDGQVSQQQAIYDQITNLTVRTFCFLSIFYADDQSSHQDFLRHPFETSRGNEVKQARHDTR